MKCDPNEPAYPTESVTYDPKGDEVIVQGFRGLTKRELFAAMAMQGFIHVGDWGIDECAENGVIAADALIAALNEEASDG